MWLHLYVGFFFNNKYYRTTWPVVGCRCGTYCGCGTTLRRANYNLNMNFWLCRGPPLPILPYTVQLCVCVCFPCLVPVVNSDWTVFFPTIPKHHLLGYLLLMNASFPIKASFIPLNCLSLLWVSTVLIYIFINIRTAYVIFSTTSPWVLWGKKQCLVDHLLLGLYTLGAQCT